MAASEDKGYSDAAGPNAYAYAQEEQLASTKRTLLGRLRSKSRGRSRSKSRGRSTGRGYGTDGYNVYGGVMSELDGMTSSPSRKGAVRLTDDDDDELLEQRIAQSRSGAADATSASTGRKKNRWPSLGRSRSRSKSKSRSSLSTNETTTESFNPYGNGRGNGRNRSRSRSKSRGKGSSSAVEDMARRAAALAEAQATARQAIIDGGINDGIHDIDDGDDANAWGSVDDVAANGNQQQPPPPPPPPLTEEERMAIESSVVRTRSREEVRAQASVLAQMQSDAQNAERRSRSGLSVDDGEHGNDVMNGDGNNNNSLGVGYPIGMNRSGGDNRLSDAARRAADASLNNRSGSNGSRGVQFISTFDSSGGGGGAGGTDWDLFNANGPSASGDDNNEMGDEERSVIRAVLNRPPRKRATLPPMAKRYAVTVNPAVYNAKTRTYQYDVLVVRGSDQDIRGALAGSSARAATLPPSKTARSLADFLFLDTYLRTEFAGASLPPLLSVALYGRQLLEVKGDDGDGGGAGGSSVASAATFGTLQPAEQVRTVSDLARRCQDRLGQDMDANVPVEETKLATWLGDVLNGIRGEGEWLLSPHSPASSVRDAPPVDVTTSEALEAFLYRNTDSLPAPPMDGGMSGGRNAADLAASASRASCLAMAMNQPDSFSQDDNATGGNKRHLASQLGSVLLAAPLACFDQRCNAQFDDMHNKMSTSAKNDDGVVSGIPGSPQTQNASSSRIAQTLTFQSPVLTAQRDVLTTYRRNATKTLHRMKILRDDEVRMATAWKRFAISLSNLFAFEKDLENARVGTLSKALRKEEKKKKPYRKITKNVIDDSLRVIAKHKVERSTPGLDAVGDMMATLLADLAAVDPCLVDYARTCSAVDDPVQKLLSSAGCAPVEDGPKWKEGSVKALGALKVAASTLANKAGQQQQQQQQQSSQGDASLSKAAAQKAERLRLQQHGDALEGSLLSLLDSTHIRSARTANRYLRTEAGRAANLRAGATTLCTKLHVSDSLRAEMAERDKRHAYENKEDDVMELGIVREMFELVQQSIDLDEDDDDTVAEEMRQSHEEMCSRALLLASERVGRWNGELALALMECSGVEDAEVRVEETTRDLRLVRKYAIGLRENVDRCTEAVSMLNGVVLGAEPTAGDDQSLDNSLQSTHSNISSSMSYEAMKINRKRELFLSTLARTLSGSPILAGADEYQRSTAVKAAQVLEQAGADFSDPSGWLAASEIIETGQEHQYRPGKCGELLVAYQQVRDADIAILLARTNQLLADYHKRVEMIESFVYMHCVGIQLEKHYSKERSEALAKFEEKTDITTAINIAMKKNLPALVEELKGKLHSLPPNISHSSVKMAKERHLISKTIKEDLQQLAEQRFQRARETSTERVITMIRMWAERKYLFPRLVFDCIYLIVDTFATYCARLHMIAHWNHFICSIFLFPFVLSLHTDEDRITNGELKALGDLINNIEKHISRHTIKFCDGGAGLLAVATARS